MKLLKSTVIEDHLKNRATFYEETGYLYIIGQDTITEFRFTEETCMQAINSLHRMLDHIICENAKKDLKGAAHE